MEVDVESTGAVTRRLKVTIPAERLETEFEARLRQMASRARLPGFRPGKAPLKVIRQQFGPSARIEAIDHLVSHTYPEALAKTQLQPAGAPHFEVEPERPGEPLVYIADIDVLPDIQIDPGVGVSAERPEVEVTEADVDRLVDNLRRARRVWEPADRPAALGDQLKIDFEGTIDGEAFPGNRAEKIEIEIGTSRFLPALEESLRGHSAGEQYDVDVHFPDDYPRENVRGKTAVFHVTVHEVQQPVLPEIDEAFLTSHSVDPALGVEGLREKCRSALVVERDKAVRLRLRQQVFDQLLEKYPIEVPPSHVRHEIERLREEAAGRVNMTKLKPEQRREMLPDNLFEAQARRRVALGLLMNELVKRTALQADSARVDKLLEEAVAEYEQPEQARQYFRSNSQLMNQLSSVALEDQLTELLLAQGEVKPVTMSLDDLLKPPRQAPA